ncbi:MAG: 2-oxo-4-hydroxy-4-carboxy-5-ureidoimidazoline decarboxylase [Streptomyces sp.]|uniref:2-oxo-4-hydroxy-4-carboxy-5-ureidoimidazoline decarboxylase n=1 Tax=Streptomyces sp. TaxID=1931 RepID=UPI003D6A0EAE
MPLPRPRSEAAPAVGAPYDGHGRAARPVPLSWFNSAPAEETTALLLGCCGSRRWAARIAACRPYPDVEALLAAVDEASYDMTHTDLAEALAAERAQQTCTVPGGVAPHARTALRAAHAAYESRFGHTFLICLDDYRPDQRLDQALAGVRDRLGNDAEEERVVVSDELRRTARGRIVRHVAAPRGLA